MSSFYLGNIKTNYISCTISDLCPTFGETVYYDLVPSFKLHPSSLVLRQ